jgi:hypothetical protein
MILEMFHNDGWHPVSEMELGSLNQVETSQSAGSLEWDVESQAADPFAFNESDIIGLRGRDSDSDEWLVLFFGKMFDAPERKHEANFCTDTFIAHDAWNDLERTAYQLTQFVAEGYNKSHIILFRDATGNRMTTGQQIKAVLDYAISKGVAVSYVQADLDAMTVQAPADEQTDLSCAEAIQKCLRWQADFYTKFDYAQTGSTLRFYSAEQEEPLPLALTDVLKQGGFSIKKKSDMTLRGVVINYEVENKIIDGTTQSVQSDSDGATEGPNVLVHTVQVDGSYQIATQENIVITCEAWPLDWKTNVGFVDRLFWQTFCSIYRAINATINYPYYITSGFQEGYGVTAYPVTVWWEVEQRWKYQVPFSDPGSWLWQVGCSDYSQNTGWRTVQLSTSFLFTSNPPGTYTRSGPPITIPGELLPTGVATAVFNARKWPLYDGTVTREIPRLGALAGPQNNINISGGLAEYLDMRAPVQRVSRNYFDELETIKFGHPEQAGITDYIDMLRANRSVNRPSRRTWRT